MPKNERNESKMVQDFFFLRGEGGGIFFLISSKNKSVVFSGNNLK